MDQGILLEVSSVPDACPLTSPTYSLRIPIRSNLGLKEVYFMQEYTTEQIRNIAMVSHSGAGKTMLGEAFLFYTKAINRMGNVGEANTVGDFEAEEQRRGLSLSTSVLPIDFR